jgi:hypothetical protein
MRREDANSLASAFLEGEAPMLEEQVQEACALSKLLLGKIMKKYKLTTFFSWLMITALVGSNLRR